MTLAGYLRKEPDQAAAPLDGSDKTLLQIVLTPVPLKDDGVGLSITLRGIFGTHVLSEPVAGKGSWLEGGRGDVEALEAASDIIFLQRICLGLTRVKKGTINGDSAASALAALLAGRPVRFPVRDGGWVHLDPASIVRPYLTSADAAGVATPFRARVWSRACSIPFGQTITYGELARAIGCGSPRAVGQALGANPLPLLIPCHRVVSQNGMGGFSQGLDVKAFLLEFEAGL